MSASHWPAGLTPESTLVTAFKAPRMYCQIGFDLQRPVWDVYICIYIYIYICILRLQGDQMYTKGQWCAVLPRPNQPWGLHTEVALRVLSCWCILCVLCCRYSESLCIESNTLNLVICAFIILAVILPKFDSIKYLKASCQKWEAITINFSSARETAVPLYPAPTIWTFEGL